MFAYTFMGMYIHGQGLPTKASNTNNDESTVIFLAEGIGIASPPSIGNSLGAKSGWSSDFDQPTQSHAVSGTMPLRNKCKMIWSAHA